MCGDGMGRSMAIAAEGYNASQRLAEISHKLSGYLAGGPVEDALHITFAASVLAENLFMKSMLRK